MEVEADPGDGGVFLSQCATAEGARHAVVGHGLHLQRAVADDVHTSVGVRPAERQISATHLHGGSPARDVAIEHHGAGSQLHQRGRRKGDIRGNGVRPRERAERRRSAHIALQRQRIAARAADRPCVRPGELDVAHGPVGIEVDGRRRALRGEVCVRSRGVRGHRRSAAPCRGRPVGPTSPRIVKSLLQREAVLVIRRARNGRHERDRLRRARSLECVAQHVEAAGYTAGVLIVRSHGAGRSPACAQVLHAGRRIPHLAVVTHHIGLSDRQIAVSENLRHDASPIDKVRRHQTQLSARHGTGTCVLNSEPRRAKHSSRSRIYSGNPGENHAVDRPSHGSLAQIIRTEIRLGRGQSHQRIRIDPRPAHGAGERESTAGLRGRRVAAGEHRRDSGSE